MKKRFLFATLMAALFTTATFTACEEDDENDDLITEQNSKISAVDVKAIAQSDGTIIIEGTVTTNTKLKEFSLTDENGKIYNLLTDTEKSKTEDGKEWTSTLSSEAIPVGIYTLTANTRFNKKVTETVGSAYSFEVGTGSNKTLGSQISLVDQKCYMLKDFYADGKITDTAIANSIEIFLQEDLTIASAKGLKVAKADAGIASTLADAKVYETAAAVITTTKCIATYKVTKKDDMTVTLSGVVINSKGTIKIDTSEAFK